MPNVRLPRDILKQFLPNHQAIRAFEQVLDQISGALPTTIEEANNNAGIAIAAANAALSAFNDLAREVMTLANAPLPIAATLDDDVAQQSMPFIADDDVSPRYAVTPEYPDIVMRYEPMWQDDVAPRTELGTMSAQNADYVEITGGGIDNTPIGAIIPSSSAFTTISATGQITSTLATGAAPMVIASTTKVSNLNADLLDGTDWAAPGTIGGTTPGSATFTTVSTTGNISIVKATGVPVFSLTATTGTNETYVQFSNNGGNYFDGVENSTGSWFGGTAYARVINAPSGRVIEHVIAGTRKTETSATGFKVIGNVGFYNTTAIAKPTVTGSRGGNAALASALTQLANLGLITDSSTA